MNKAVYIISKILMGVMVLVMLLTITSNKLQWNHVFAVPLTLGLTVLFSIGSRITGVNRGRSRLTYEVIPYVGGIATIILAIKYSVTAAEIREIFAGTVYVEDKVRDQRLFLILFVGSIILFLAAKTYCLMYETEDYKNKAGERAKKAERAKEDDLDKEVEYATEMIARSRDDIERRDWETKLEKAKNKREKYYRDRRR